jgi:hypothetical protein
VDSSVFVLKVYRQQQARKEQRFLNPPSLKIIGISLHNMSTSTAMSGNAETSVEALHSLYPMTSKWEFTLKNGDKISGEIYCTDPVSDLVVVQEQTTDIRMISIASIQESKLLNEASGDAPKLASSMAHTKKALEEREKRAIRLAQER